MRGFRQPAAITLKLSLFSSKIACGVGRSVMEEARYTSRGHATRLPEFGKRNRNYVRFLSPKIGPIADQTIDSHSKD